MANERSPQLAVVRSATDVLDAAFRQVAARIDTVLSGHEGDGEDAREYLERLAAAVRARIADPEVGAPELQVTTHPLFELFLDAISAELVDEPTDAESALSAVQVLRAVVLLRSGGLRSGAAGRDQLEDLRARLRAPDAFELLIEVAHDFRSPLTSILFLAETLRDGNSGEVTELQRSQLGLMYSAAFGLASVASDVMDLARREKDLIEDETHPYALAEVFTSVQRLVNPIVEEKGLELRVVVPDRAHAHGYPHALSRVLLNLTTNALKFTDEGHVEIGVKRLPRSRLEFYVQDTGRGIPPDRQTELFLPFKRRLGQGQEGHFFSGSGVGLSIAHRLVKAMGSELILDTSDECGTRFSFVVHATPRRHL